MNAPTPRHSTPLTLTALAACAMIAAAVCLPAVAHAAPAATPVATSPASSDTVVPIAFAVHGAATVRTGIRGTVAVDGTFAGRYDRAAGTFSGAFTLKPTVAHVVVLGLVGADADTDWIFTEPVTGAWKDGVLSLRAAAKIHHGRLTAFGHTIAGGPNCATVRPSVLELHTDSAAPVANPFDGGTLTTDRAGFSISALSGCGWLDGALSAVAAGGGNQASFTLSPLPAQ